MVLFCFFQEMYRTTQPFDPEGVLSTINSIVIGFLGMQVRSKFLLYDAVSGMSGTKKSLSPAFVFFCAALINGLLLPSLVQVSAFLVTCIGRS